MTADSATNSTAVSSTCIESSTSQGERPEFTIVLSVYGSVGLVGNLLIFIVYSRERGKLSHATYIYTLAIVDLIVCGVIIPYTILFERRAITSDVICRGLELLRHTLVMVSNILLLAIAVERYRSVFKPWRPDTQRKARKIIAAIFVACAICGSPAVTIFAVSAIPQSVTSASAGSNVTSCVAHAYCRYTTEMFGEMWARMYQSFLALEFFAAVSVIAILYVNVYRQIWARVKWRKRLAPQALRTGGCHPNTSQSRSENTVSNFPHKAQSQHAWSTSESKVYPCIESGTKRFKEIILVRERNGAPELKRDTPTPNKNVTNRAENDDASSRQISNKIVTGEDRKAGDGVLDTDGQNLSDTLTRVQKKGHTEQCLQNEVKSVQAVEDITGSNTSTSKKDVTECISSTLKNDVTEGTTSMLRNGLTKGTTSMLRNGLKEDITSTLRKDVTEGTSSTLKKEGTEYNTSALTHDRQAHGSAVRGRQSAVFVETVKTDGARIEEEGEEDGSSTDSLVPEMPVNSGTVFLKVPVRSSRKLKSAQKRQSVPHREHPVRVIIDLASETHVTTAAANLSKTDACTPTPTTNHHNNNSNNNNNEPSRHDNRKKAGTMLFICTLIYVLTWLPFWIDIFGATHNLLFRYTFLLGHVTNPLVYGVVNTKVRDEIKRLLLCR